MERNARSLVWAGLLMGAVAACGTDDSTQTGGTGGDGDGEIDSGADLRTSKTGLLRAESCPDLLTKIKSDAIAKLDLTAALIKSDPERYLNGRGGGGIGVPVDDGAVGGDADGPAPPSAEPGAGEGSGSSGGNSGDGGGDPTGSSSTNTQVEGVDEADFVKVVNSGKGMFVLHGSKLLKLKSWPAADTALQGAGLEIEGAPSEMFVTDAGKAVVFSSVFGYDVRGSGKGEYYCGPGYCGGSNFTKVTIADVAGDVPKTERELYYEGYYVSSRRYSADAKDVVRVVLQANTQYYNLYSPSISLTDPFGNAYTSEEIGEQVDQWRDRTAADILDTTLENWMPLVQEAKDGKLADVEPSCDSYYLPPPGLSDYGLTHVLSLDVANPAAAVGGVTIMGATSTVYSNADTMVLAQPDYRASVDFGFIDLQQTALHVFGLAGEDTSYRASGFVPGILAGNIPQFALDVNDGTIRAATTGWERVNPDAEPYSDGWWQTAPVNRVVTAKVDGSEVKVADELSPLGHDGEQIRSSRFLGNRGYIVTFRQTDPLIVVDVSNPAALAVLGEVEIPGFSEYMHPLDENHLVTLGQNATQWGLQLQIFDVSDATKPKQTHVLDFGQGTGSEGSYQHKAFTYFAEKKLLALPLYNYNGPTGFSSGLAVIRVDATNGFDEIGRVDHSALIQQQTCGYCDAYGGCYDEPCYSYYPDVRRGHFVTGQDGTYVYSFSYGGVLVHDVADLTSALATVTLPSPEWSGESWYGEAGGANGGGATGGVDTPKPDDPAPAPDQDAGTGTAEPEPADAGVAMGG